MCPFQGIQCGGMWSPSASYQWLYFWSVKVVSFFHSSVFSFATDKCGEIWGPCKYCVPYQKFPLRFSIHQ